MILRDPHRKPSRRDLAALDLVDATLVAERGSGFLGRGVRSNPRRVAISVAVSGLILLADILTRAKGLAGVLYVPLLVAIATEARRREVMAFGLLGIALAAAAFVIAHARSPQTVGVWPLGVGLIAVVVTSVLLARLVGSREALQETNRQLAYSEWRFRSIFEQSRFPFWERDFSHAFATYARLKAKGITDLVAHNDRHPGFIEGVAASIVTLEVNDAMLKLVGARTRDAFPRTLADMKPNPSMMLALHQKLFEGIGRLDGRSTLTTLDGQTKDVWVTSELSPDPTRPGVMVGFLVDLTEVERAQRVFSAAQAELARASRVATVGALSASIAHELNQPLAAVVMNAQTALRYPKRTSPDIPAATAAIERAAREGSRAADIVRQTRELVTNRAGREDVVELKALVLDVLGLLDHDIKDASVEVDLQCPPQGIELVADRVALQQVLVNLVGNAVQAMTSVPSQPRHLRIALGHDRDDVVIAVRDTGPGIADDHLARLFDPFFTTKQGGIGVGLAISRAAVEARGGVLRAANAEGGGAVFECRLPLVRDDG